MYSPLHVPETGVKPFTDYSRWRLLVNDGGRHVWKYLKTDCEMEEWPQNTVDKYWMGLPVNLPTLPTPKTPLEAAKNGYTFYKELQCHDGHWAGEYGGPMFLLPGMVIGSYVAGMGFTDEQRLEMVRYLFNHVNSDGGWGIHIEGHSTVFGTALNYAALRILGVSAEHPICIKARGTLHKFGGATGIPTWGKFWLSVLNVYDWEGLNPIPPELLIVPDSLPIHPRRWWIHTRIVFIPMAYLYGIKYKKVENELILSLRQELYTTNYYKINWPAQRNNVSPLDMYSPHTKLFDFLNVILGAYESCTIPFIRRKGLERAYELIVFEDENTAYQTIAPVSKMINLMVRAVVDGPDSEAYRMHNLRRLDFLWLAAEGMMVTGTNGSQLWDHVFITQALVETGLADLEENKESVRRALVWLEGGQMLENPKHFETSYRHRTKGAWGFSTREQGYTVSDCTGEGLKSALYLQEQLSYTSKLVSKERMCDAVDTMLSLQNPNGGFASYELVRGPWWLEWLNAAEVFGNIMIEYCYPECTTSVITSLHIFKKHHPDYRSKEIDGAIHSAVRWLHSVQQPEGGWYGSWGICLTYATMFALESLSLAGETYENSDSVRRACDFLVGKQRADGGWGESYKSCETMDWVEHKNTQVVQTSWAAMALMYAKYPHPEPLEKAVKLVMGRQLPDGSWAQEAIEGVFNKTVAISYPNFKFSFTIWMLGKADGYLQGLKEAVVGNGKADGSANGYH